MCVNFLALSFTFKFHYNELGYDRNSVTAYLPSSAVRFHVDGRSKTVQLSSSRSYAFLDDQLCRAGASFVFGGFVLMTASGL